jgi:hypothetical protein
MDTKSTCVVGGYRANSGATFDPTPDTGCAAFDDPLAWLPAPPEASLGCTYNDVVVQNGEVRSFPAGVYCKKLEINSGGKAIFGSIRPEWAQARRRAGEMQSRAPAAPPGAPSTGQS